MRNSTAPSPSGSFASSRICGVESLCFYLILGPGIVRSCFGLDVAILSIARLVVAVVGD
jgi:hypothetical protein